MAREPAGDDPRIGVALQAAFRCQADGPWAVAAVAVTSDGRRGTWYHGAQPSSTFELGSVTKTFTALLLATLCTQGRVRLDDPVGAYLPAASGASTTLLDLATHSAGYPRLPRSLLRYALAPDPYSHVSDAQVERALRRLSSRPKAPARHPFRYSNFGYGILARALASAAGGAFSDVLRTEVLGPLGLELSVDVEHGEGRMPGHRPSGRRTSPWHNRALAGAGCLWGNVGYLGDYLAAHLRPEQTPLAPAIDLVLRPQRAATPCPDEVCLGWFVRDVATGRVHWHNGSTYGFGSSIALDRARGVAVGVLVARGQPPDLEGGALTVMEALARDAAGSASGSVSPGG